MWFSPISHINDKVGHGTGRPKRTPIKTDLHHGYPTIQKWTKLVLAMGPRPTVPELRRHEIKSFYSYFVHIGVS